MTQVDFRLMLFTCSYGNDQYRALLGYYERTYEKLSALNPPIPMMFAPGKPDSDPFQLWQGFINGKNPSLLVYEVRRSYSVSRDTGLT